jgi:hypothetical protein
MIYHVSTLGSDSACGSAECPFLTIGHAASVARPGDTVKVHGGTYREWVDPIFSGETDARIIYEAAEGERPIIKGSEIVTDFDHVGGTIYKKVIKNSFFGDFNPFAEKLTGDWLQRPNEYDIHLGDVYIDGKSAYEAVDMAMLESPTIRESWFMHPLSTSTEYLLHPEDTKYQWIATVDDENTTVYVNFADKNPATSQVEISVRPTCFTPKRTGVNYITVRGFEMAHAATQWAPPTADQTGLIGPHLAKGWIIEDNIIHDARCAAVSVGKDGTTGDNMYSRYRRKAGGVYQFEEMLAAKRAGIHTIILPEDNRKDVEEITKEYIEGLTFHYVRTNDQVLELALEK